jgi:hypothetical protein
METMDGELVRLMVLRSRAVPQRRQHG